MFDVGSGEAEEVEKNSVDFYGVCAIQVGSTLFGFENACDPAEWNQYFAQGRIDKKAMATPSQPRSCPSLANF